MVSLRAGLGPLTRDLWILIHRRDRHDPWIRMVAERIAPIFAWEETLFSAA